MSPANLEKPQAVSKSSSSTGAGTRGNVKRLSAHFEALNKQVEGEPSAEGR